jgi:hypothetical protein
VINIKHKPWVDAGKRCMVCRFIEHRLPYHIIHGYGLAAGSFHPTELGITFAGGYVVVDCVVFVVVLIESGAGRAFHNLGVAHGD